MTTSRRIRSGSLTAKIMGASLPMQGRLSGWPRVPGTIPIDPPVERQRRAGSSAAPTVGQSSRGATMATPRSTP
jgi:hypothetical protein